MKKEKWYSHNVSAIVIFSKYGPLMSCIIADVIMESIHRPCTGSTHISSFWEGNGKDKV